MVERTKMREKKMKMSDGLVQMVERNSRLAFILAELDDDDLIEF